MRAIISTVLLCTGTLPALGQSYSASGHIGYLQEWELNGSLARTTTRSGADYAGPVTLRHVGLCSTNGIEEKTAVVRLKVSSSRLEGTLAMDDDSCRIVAPGAASYSGLMSCRNGQGVPINFLIEERAPPAMERLVKPSRYPERAKELIFDPSANGSP